MKKKKPIKQFLHYIFNKLNLDGWFLLFYESALTKDGWFRSYRTKSPIDKKNNPIPWITYPCLDFISNRISKELNLFEFGCGNSTLYFSNKVKKIVTVEHNKDWFYKISKDLPSNIKLIYKELKDSGEYSNCAKTQNEKYDVIIVDGVDRNNCIYNSINSLNEHGTFILDDSERDEYNEAITFLIDNNFKRIDFWGMAPGIHFKKCTTVFYRKDNCLNI